MGSKILMALSKKVKQQMSPPKKNGKSLGLFILTGRIAMIAIRNNNIAMLI
jgi:hypothetical protein